MVAAAIADKSEVKIMQVGLNPTRTGILSLLKLMDVNIEVSNKRVIGGEPIGDIKVISSSLIGISVPPELVPQAIDEFTIINTNDDSILFSSTESRE